MSSYTKKTVSLGLSASPVPSLLSGHGPLTLFNAATHSSHTRFRASLAATCGHMAKFWPMRRKGEIERGHVLLSEPFPVCSWVPAWNADVTAGAPATLLAPEATVRPEVRGQGRQKRKVEGARVPGGAVAPRDTPGPPTSGVFFSREREVNFYLFKPLCV